MVMARSSSGWRSISSTRARKLEQLVEEQHAVVRQRDLARPHRRTPADQARRRHRVVRRAERARRRSAPSRRAGRRSNRPSSSPAPRRTPSGGRMPGSRWASIVFPEPGAPTNSRLWPPAAAISSARRGTSCPRTSARSSVVGAAAARRARRRRGRGCRRVAQLAAQQRHQRGEIRRRLHVDAADDRGLACVVGRDDQPAHAAPARPGGDRQHAAHRPQGAVERQLADQQRAVQRRRIDRAGRGQHAGRDRDVERGAVLAQIGGREVDRGPARRQLEAAVVERAPDAQPPFADARVGRGRRCCSTGARRRRRPRRRSARLRSRSPRRTRHARTCALPLRARCQRNTRFARPRAPRRPSPGRRRPSDRP